MLWKQYCNREGKGYIEGYFSTSLGLHIHIWLNFLTLVKMKLLSQSIWTWTNCSPAVGIDSISGEEHKGSTRKNLKKGDFYGQRKSCIAYCVTQYRFKSMGHVILFLRVLVLT